MNEPTNERLHAMRLGAMADAWHAQNRDPKTASLGFDERFAMLVDAEFLARDNRRLARLLKDADLRIPSASLEDVEVSPTRGLDKSMLRQLANGSWVQERLSVLITGATGVGKSYLACALGQHACRRGHRVLYRRVPRLLDELALARIDGTYAKLLAKLARAEVLVLDDLGLSSLKDAQRHDLLEVLEDRYDRSSTIVTSQLPTDAWHKWIADPTIADAILDRLVNRAYKVALQGGTRRGRKGEAEKKD